jgi:hypothetical protein
MHVGLSPQLLRQTFPFHIAFRADGSVVQAGPVIERLCPELAGILTRPIGDERPALTLDFATIQQHPRTVFVLEAWLGAAVQHHRNGKLEDLRDGVLDDVARWAARRDDDATLVLLRRAN